MANNATIEDGITLCNAKFGRTGWTSAFGAKSMSLEMIYKPQALGKLVCD